MKLMNTSMTFIYTVLEITFHGWYHVDIDSFRKKMQ